MKLVMAIVSNDDANKVQSALVKERYQITRLATTGGFLMSGNTTLICGTDNEKVEDVIDIISKHSKKRTQMVPTTSSYGVGMYSAFPVEVTVGGATIFVIDVDQFKKV